MSERLFVATRKGLFEFHRVADGSPPWQLAGVHFLGEPVTMVLHDARDGSLHAALNLGHFGAKMRRSHDGGATWQESPVPAYPAADATDEAAEAATLFQVWALETGGADRPGLLWAGTIPGGLFRSDDGGDSWLLQRGLWDRPERREWVGGGYDQPGIHSVCVDPRDSARLTVGVSCGGVWLSEDGGASWAARSNGMIADYMPPERAADPNVQDPHRVVQCAAAPEVMWVQHHCGIYRTVDGGANWQRLTARPSSFGFAVAVHPQDPDTAWFVPAVKDECRVPVDGQLVVTRTRDGGASFEALHRGLPRAAAYDLVYRHGLDVDASGTRLAMGSTTGGLWISDNGGDDWHCLSAHLPPIYCVRFAA
jgi:hypothetical protein